MQFDTILFDLDGTLTDPGLGITNSIMYALQQEGMPVPPRQELYRFIGPPLVEEFQSVYGVSKERALALLAGFRTYFEKQGIFENQMYAGIPEMLERLRSAGCRLILATSKPEVFAAQVLEHFGLRDFFQIVAGSTIDETRTNKADVIAYALGRLGTAPHAVLVGDRCHDILGAKANGLKSMGVLYGYGSREELTDAGADLLAAQVNDVAELLLRDDLMA